MTSSLTAERRFIHRYSCSDITLHALDRKSTVFVNNWL